MTKTLIIPNGIITLSESKAECSECKKSVSFDKIEDKYMKSKDGHIKHKCECGHKFGITMNIRGDFVSYNLE